MSEYTPIGILGGTGLYEMPEMQVEEERRVETPFGDPSDLYIMGRLEERPVIFLSRHGRGHRRAAPHVNYRANIYGFKALGTDAILSVGAVGSLKEELPPLDIVLPDQFIDLTKKRSITFFEEDIAVHVSIADPVCPYLLDVLLKAGANSGARVHGGGTYLCMEGPAFSTRAESEVYRSWGADIIGMTMATEAKLAREAEICYSSIALITDYDVWKEKEEDVSVDVILDHMRKNIEASKRILRAAVPAVKPDRECDCRSALGGAIVSHEQHLTPEKTRGYGVLLHKYRED